MRICVLGRELEVSCDAGRERRVRDLASSLEARINFKADPDEVVRLALALLDEAQMTQVALERARLEIERLTDLLVNARMAADPHVIADDRLGAAHRPPFIVQGSA